MRCDDLHGPLAGLVADDLTPAQAEVVRLHLGQCLNCQERYTGLMQTRRQLSQLAGDYHPSLAPRITRAIDRHRTRHAILHFVGQGLRALGAASTILVVVAFLIWQSGPSVPASPMPNADAPRKVYLLRGRAWTEIDMVQGRTRAFSMPNGELRPDGLLVGDDLYTLSRADPLRPAKVPLQSELDGLDAADAPLRDLPLLRSGDTAWAVRTEWPSERIIYEPIIPRFAVDRIDLITGQLDRDEAWKEGLVQRSALSPNGGYLYLVADLEGHQYVKVVDARTSRLVTAFQLPRPFSPLASLLISPDGGYLHLVDGGRWLTLDLVTGRFRAERESDEITAVAALDPDGGRMLAARPDGGLGLWGADGSNTAGTDRLSEALVFRDTRDVDPLRLTDGPRYRSLTWYDAWIYATHDEGIDLINAETLQVTHSYPLPLPGPIYVP